jgi:rSAM/selenodomain-associated transferase 2
VTGRPSLSVILPVLNEARDINDALVRLRGIDDGSLRDIVLSDGDPAGSTIAAVNDLSVTAVAGPPGRGGQMNRGAALAAGDVLLFLHADTILPPRAFERIRLTLADPSITGGAFDLGIASPRWYFRITERYAACRTRLTRIPFGDQAIFLRREFFERIGRYADIPIMEDVELMGRVRRNGGRIAIIPEKVLTSARRWEKDGVLFTTCRNWMLQGLYCLGVRPQRLARYYR